MTDTNEKGIIEVIEKAIKRAEWYADNFKFARDFQKRLKNQFWNVIFKWLKTHDLTNEQKQSLLNKVPEQYNDALCNISIAGSK